MSRPDRIGPYHVLDVLGEGGMGIVYLAEQRTPIHRRVALKVVKPGLDSREVLARFEAERQALALLSHPNIAKVLDAGSTATGAPYFVMEHVRGIPITDYADKQRLPIDERLALFEQVCAAIQHAHDNGILHRDVKPSNVLVESHGGKPTAKIIDFGVAKATNQRLTERTLFTEQGRIVGTPEYMSPEQAEMTGLDVDHRTDVYSAGVLLYELLVGALPFDSHELRKAGYSALQRRIRDEDPPTPSRKLTTLGGRTTDTVHRRQTTLPALRRALRAELDQVVMKAIEKDPVRRYQRIADLGDDVGRHLRGEPVRARPPSALRHARRWVARRRGAVLAGVAVTALAVLAVERVLHARSVAALQHEHDALAGELASRERSFEAESRALAAERERLAAERAELAQHIAAASQLADPGTDLGALRSKLAAADDKLERFEPLHATSERLRSLGVAQAATVLVESTVDLVDRRTGRRPDLRPAFEPRRSRGLGFVVSGDGFVLTLDSVIGTRRVEESIAGLDLEARAEVAVVFPHENRARPARIVASTADDAYGVTLLQVDAFDGMPVVAGFDLDAPLPPPGSEVYVLGYPTGALRAAGEHFVPATFRGILSRLVDEHLLQIDAAIHPGSAGGPLIDDRGRVIGIVAAIQRDATGAIAPTLGYAVRLGGARPLWPRRG